MPVTVLLELRFKPESVSEGTELFRRELVKTRAFDGNLVTDVLVDEDDETHWVIYESWDVRPGGRGLPELPRRARARSPSFLPCWPGLQSRPGTPRPTSSEPFRHLHETVAIVDVMSARDRVAAARTNA